MNEIQQAEKNVYDEIEKLFLAIESRQSEPTKSDMLPICKQIINTTKAFNNYMEAIKREVEK